MSMKTCETLGCEKEARLQCPTCIKLQIKVIYRMSVFHVRMFLYDFFRALFSVAKNAFLAAGTFTKRYTSWPSRATQTKAVNPTGLIILGQAMFLLGSLDQQNSLAKE